MGGAEAALSAFYAARIEATRRSTAPKDRAAAVRALLDEQRAAFRALAERRQMLILAAMKAREIERHGEREARRRARTPPRLQST